MNLHIPHRRRRLRCNWSQWTLSPGCSVDRLHVNCECGAEANVEWHGRYLVVKAHLMAPPDDVRSAS